MQNLGIGDLFWVFFIFMALQPVLKQRLMEASRQRLIAKIEQDRKSRVVLLVHRQETMSFLGFPFFRYIDIHDSEQVIRAVHLTDPDVSLDLVLHTPGGLVLASVQIAHAIRKHPGKVTVFVPHYAMSGGTLIALAADEIVMSESAVLGPVDPQLGQQSAASVLSVLHKKPLSEIKDETLMLADQAEKAIAQVRQTVRELLENKCAPAKARELADLLATGTWTHDYPITCEVAREFGLGVRSEMPREILQLMNLYPQPVRKHPSVEYLPTPRHSEEPKPR